MKVLLVEDQTAIREIIHFTLELSFDFDVVTADTVALALKVLEQNPDIELVICDFSLPDSSAVEIFDFLEARERPFYFISTSKQHIDKFPEFFDKKVTAYVTKQHTVSNLLEIIKQLIQPKKVATEELYAKVSVDLFLLFGQISEDIFMKLPSGRYLKIFNAGDYIQDEDVEKWRQKGTKEFYVLKETTQWILKQVSEQFGAQVENLEEGPVSVKLVLKHPLDELLGDVSGPFQFEEYYLKTVQSKVKNSLAIVAKNKTLMQYLKQLKLNAAARDYFITRTGLLCNISCHLAKLMDWSTEPTLLKLIYCAHVHDLTLVSYPQLACVLDLGEFDAIKDQFSSKGHELLINHPKVVADIVEKDVNAPMEAHTIVLQHHENADKTGFPNGISQLKMASLSCLFALSLHMAETIIKNGGEFDLKKFINDWRTHPRYKGNVFIKIFQNIEDGMKKEKA